MTFTHVYNEIKNEDNTSENTQIIHNYIAL